MRDNSQRIGVDQQSMQTTEVPQAALEGKSSISYSQPTEMVDLPTQGKFYPKGHPLHDCDCIEIRHMTAKDEEILMSPTLLQKGLAVDKMLQGLLVNQQIKVGDLYIGDKNAITLAARNSAYEEPYNVSITCPSCGRVTPKEIDLKVRKPKLPAEDVVISEQGTFQVKIPNTNFVVEMKLLTGSDEKSIRDQSEKKKKLKLQESPVTDLLKKLIVSVNGDSGGEVIEQFVDSLLARYSRFLREEYGRISPNMDLKEQFECPGCGAEAMITIPFTANFFWPNR